MNVTRIDACRSCGHRDLATVLDLGNLAVSDFIEPGQSLDRAPLELVRCTSCELVQLRHTVDRDRLYRTYHYRSGVNETMVAALKDVADEAMKLVPLDYGDVVLDIGCNDGTLLRHFPNHVRKIGIDPSDVATDAQQFDPFATSLVRDFFPPKGQHVPHKCKIITAIACFYDVDDPNAFIREAKRWLHDDGVLIVQFQDLVSMVNKNAFDNICHEHLTYWDYNAVSDLIERHALQITGIAFPSINGGSIRFVIQHHNASRVSLPKAYSFNLRSFAARIEALKHDTLRFLHEAKRTGKTVIGYAASTKANTLLQYYGIGPDLIEAFMERSPHKWGKTTVTGIPIISEDEGRERNPAFLFVGAWQFADAFAKREHALLERGTQLVVPLPTLRLMGVADHADFQPKDLASSVGVESFT